MAYALIQGNVLELASEELPLSLQGQPVSVQEAAGWFMIDEVTNPRPSDTATTYFASRFVVVGGRPVQVWDELPKTQKMIDDESRSIKASNIRSVLDTAYARLKQIEQYPPPDVAADRSSAQTISTATFANNTQRDNAIKSLAGIADRMLLEQSRTQAAVQDLAKMLRYLDRLYSGGTYLDATAD